MSVSRLVSALALSAALYLSLGPGGAPVLGQEPPVGFPSVDANDGKFVALAGSGLSTVAQPVSFWLGIPAGQGSFALDVFDGDLGGLWDVHDPAGTARANFVLFADPLKNGQGTTIVASKSSADFGDDAWGTMYSGPVHGAARSPGGNHFYRLAVSFAEASASINELNGFKARVNGQVGIIPGTFGFLGAPINVDVLTGRADPAPGTARNQYNGEWHWHVYAPTAGAAISFTDTDADSRTSITRPGNPPDNCSAGATCFSINPDVRYEVLEGSTKTLNVTSPSGDLETVTRTVSSSRAGFLDWHWTGVDGHNLIFVSSSHEVFSSSAQVPLLVTAPPPSTVPPVISPGPSLIDDPRPAQSTIRGRVFADDNCNGVQDAGEMGLDGVGITIDSGGGWSAGTLSGAGGEYGFGGLSAGKFSLTAAIPAAFPRTKPTSQERIDVDGRVQTVVAGMDLGMVKDVNCATAAAPAPAPAGPKPPLPWPPTGPATTWYMSEGNTGTRFETRLLLTNPGSEPAMVTLTVYPEGATPVNRMYVIPESGSLDILANEITPGVALGAKVEADQPVTLERTMVFNETGRHTGIGSPVLDTRWLIPEIDTAGGLETWVLVMNPNPQPANLVLGLTKSDGATVEARYLVSPASRLTIYVNGIAPESVGWASAESDLPLVVEASTYWNGALSGFNTVAVPSAALP